MTPEEFLKTRGFSPAWLEEKQETKTLETDETATRKDLDMLLKELDDIKQDFEKITQKKEEIKRILNFYSRLSFN